jgi:hypothetical protein
MNEKVNEGEEVKEAVIDKVQEMFEKAKSELEKVLCPTHGVALKKLEFNRNEGRFNIETCCDEGDKLVQEAIAKI